MLKRISFLSTAVLLGLVPVASAAPSRPAALSGLVPQRDYVARLDGQVVSANRLDGSAVAAWTYRGSGETDIAVAIRDVDGSWSGTVFFGQRDRVDQAEPAVVVDGRGTTYLAFASRVPGRVYLSMLPAGATAWTRPELISGSEAAASPALAIVRDRLVVGVKTVRGIQILDLPGYIPGASSRGIQDGPDSVDPLGASDPGNSGGGSDDGDQDGTPLGGGGSGNGNGGQDDNK